MAFEHIVYEAENGIITITFNRPKALNALNKALLSELNQALIDIENDDSARVLILTGSGSGGASKPHSRLPDSAQR